MFVYRVVYILAVVLVALVLITKVTDVSNSRTFGEIDFCAFTFQHSLLLLLSLAESNRYSQ